jgi:hypothetical protein
MPIPIPHRLPPPVAKVDISLLLMQKDSSESGSSPPTHQAGHSHSNPRVAHTRSSSVPPSTAPASFPPAPSASGRGSNNTARGGRAALGSSKRGLPPHSAESPAKKQSKWSAEEDALIIDLRGGGMKWEDISKRLPGRSAISCRLHYQNYLERRSEWDEERKNKLARLYER